LQAVCIFQRRIAMKFPGMKTLAVAALAVTIGFAVPSGDAEAKRLGGSKSFGMQRQMTPPAKSPAAAPAPSQAASANAAAPAAGAAATGAAAQAGKRSWMGPIAGLAAGLGLAALASHLGFGEGLANFMMMALLAVAVIGVIGYFMRKKAMAQQPAMAGAGMGNGMAYAAQQEPAVSRFEKVDSGETAAAYVPGGSASGSAASGNIPADFDVPGFVRNAKVHFIRLQAANDSGNLDDLRAFTTPEMFAELKMDISERNGTTQETDVVAIDAEILEVIEEAGRYVASVRFTGQIREDRGAAQPVDEMWHLVKPVAGQGGWMLAGIQQIQ
jgi:predicted lipid-binding transport protein (Tim44 family)